MNCEKVCELLHIYLDGQLADWLKVGVESHLEGCTICRDELEWLRRVVRGLEPLELIEPSASFTNKVMANLPEQPAEVILPKPSLLPVLFPVLVAMVPFILVIKGALRLVLPNYLNWLVGKFSLVADFMVQKSSVLGKQVLVLQVYIWILVGLLVGLLVLMVFQELLFVRAGKRLAEGK